MPRKAEVTAPAVHTEPAKGAKFVTVACKIPNGLVLQLQRQVTYWEDTPSGGKQRTRWDRFGKRYIVRGTAYPAGAVPPGFPSRPPIVGGYALTPGIPKEFWDEWLEQNKTLPMVVNKIVFAYASLAHVRGDAAEHKDTRSGFEPLQPEGDPRMPKPADGVNISMVATADEMQQFDSFQGLSDQ